MVSAVNGRTELKPVTTFTGEKGPLALRTPHMRIVFLSSYYRARNKITPIHQALKPKPSPRRPPPKKVKQPEVKTRNRSQLKPETLDPETLT